MSVADLPIALDHEAIAAFCRKRGIRKLSLFGSVLREDFEPGRSDVDVWAEFKPGAVKKPAGIFMFMASSLARCSGIKWIFAPSCDLGCARSWKSALSRSMTSKHHNPRGPLFDMRA